MGKKYVGVNADFTPDGQRLPRAILWEDGRKFEIDRILDIKRAASLKAGGVGIRYVCMICGRQRYLFYEGNNLWFVEER